MQRADKFNGLSFIELLITLFVLLLLAGIALPMLQRYREQANQHMVQFALVSFLQTAQQEAYVRDVKIGVSFNEKTHEILMFVDEAGNGEIKAPEQIIAIKKLAKGVLHLHSYPFYRGYLQFQPGVFSASDNSTIWYCSYPDNKPLWLVTINRSHAIHVNYPDKNQMLLDSKEKILSC